MLKKLSPQQRRVAIAVAVGGVLALAAILMRRGSGAGGVQDATANPVGSTGLPDGYSAGQPSTFADNGAGFGQMTTAISDLPAQVAAAVAGVLPQPQAPASDPGISAPAQVADATPAIANAPGPAGDTGTVINVYAAPAKTGTQAKAAAPRATPKAKAKPAPKQTATVVSRSGHVPAAMQKAATGGHSKPAAHATPHKSGKSNTKGKR